MSSETATLRLDDPDLTKAYEREIPMHEPMMPEIAKLMADVREEDPRGEKACAAYLTCDGLSIPPHVLPEAERWFLSAAASD
jgi:hypothetical protein